MFTFEHCFTLKFLKFEHCFTLKFLKFEHYFTLKFLKIYLKNLNLDIMHCYAIDVVTLPFCIWYIVFWHFKNNLCSYLTMCHLDVFSCNMYLVKRGKERNLTHSYDTDRKIQKATKNATKNFDNTTIADRLRMASWGNYGYPTGVVEPVYGIPTFPLTAKAM